MRFVNIHHISNALDIKKTRIDSSFILKIKSALKVHFVKNKELHISNFTFNYNELILIIDQIQNEKHFVFHDWIEQNNALSNYLLSNGKVVGNPSPAIDSIKEHQLFDAYKRFLSPYLTSILKEKINYFIHQKDFSQLATHLNYCTLLPQSKEIEVQRPIPIFIKKQITLFIASKENEFKTTFKFLFSSPFVFVLNQLNSEYYSTLIAYIDTAKRLVNQSQSSLSALQLNRMKTSLLQLKLNSQHQKQMNKFCQSSVFEFKTPVILYFYNLLKSPLFLIGIAVIAFVLLILYWPEPKQHKKNFVATTTGIDSLTNEELNQVDSLFGYKSDSVNKGGDNAITSGVNTKQYAVTGSLNTIKNKNAKALYSSIILDYQIRKTKGLFNNCGPTKKSLFHQPLYDSVVSFSSIPSTTHTLYNKSKDELYILAFNPKKNGKIYGALIAAKSSLEIQLKKDQNIIFYSGRQMNYFNPMRRKNNGYGNINDAKKVIQGFNYHFCYQNIYNYQQLNKIYTVVKENGTLTFKNRLNNGFEVKSKALEIKK